jgi:hypothetical protein
MLYKRNQVEGAIARMWGEKSDKPSAEFRTRIKRLLDTDRTLGRKPRAADPELANYAFYTGDAPGKGFEVGFTEFEAFSLLTAFGLLHHGWPQGFAVNMLRRVRHELEKEHARILKQDPKSLFDDAAIQREAREGDIAVDSTDPVFLVIVSRNDPARSLSGSICRGKSEMFELIHRMNARSWTAHELTKPAHHFRVQLATIKPTRRGRFS